jgi:DNA-binding SARP family transcriptional activator
METLDASAGLVRADPTARWALLDDIRAKVAMLRDQVDLLWDGAAAMAQREAPYVPVSPQATPAQPLPTAPIYARCLGGFAIYRDGIELSVGKSRAAQEICRYLVAHAGRRVSSEDLIELVWPDADAEPAAHRLHVAVSALRHALESSGQTLNLVHSEEGAYYVPRALIVTDCDLFNRRYEAAKAWVHTRDVAFAASAFKSALDLYSGDYFADIPYAEWTHDARAHYMERRLSALTFLCEHAEREGNYLEVVESAQAMLSTDNLREIAHRHLMRAHYYLGQRGVAIRQFKLCAELLQRELGVAPSRLTRALYEAIRDDGQLPSDPFHLA